MNDHQHLSDRRSRPSYTRRAYNRHGKCDIKWIEVSATGEETEIVCGRSIKPSNGHPDEVDICTEHSKHVKHMTNFYDRHRHEGLPLWVENLMAANKENDIQWTMSYRELYRLHKPDTLKIAARRPRKLPDVDDSTGVVSCIPADPEENGTDLKSRGLVTVWNSHSNTDSSMLVLEQNDHATPPIEVTINLELIASRHLDARSVPRTSSENFVRHRAISERGEDRDKQLFVPGEPDLDDLILLNDPSLDVVTPFPEPSHAPLQIISPMEHYRVFLPSMHNQDVGLTNRELKNPTHSLHPSNQPNSHDRMSNYVKYDQPWVEGSDFYSRDISLQLAVLDSHSHQIQQRRSDFYSQDISEQLAQMSQVNNSSLAYGHSARPDLYFQDQWYINDV